MKEFNIEGNICIIEDYIPLDRLSDKTIIYFGNKPLKDNLIYEKLQAGEIQKIILVGFRQKGIKDKNVVFTDKITKGILKNEKSIFFIIDIDIDETIIKSLIKIKDVSDEFNIKLGVEENGKYILGTSSEIDRNLEQTLIALFTKKTKRQRYEYIYDCLCDYLDEEYKKDKFCKFDNGKCIYNRHDKSRFNEDGCCDAFKYNGIFCYNIRKCEYLSKTGCTVKNLGCKLFYCEYLKKQGIHYSLHTIILSKGFFTRKDRELLRTTFFVPKEEVIEKLCKLK